MALLDFFNSPNAALAAGLLSPNQGGSFGTSLLSGIQASQGARQNNTQDQLGQLRGQLLQREIDSVPAMESPVGKPNPSNFTPESVQAFVQSAQTGNPNFGLLQQTEKTPQFQQTINTAPGNVNKLEAEAAKVVGGGLGERANKRIMAGFEGVNQNVELDRVKLALARGAGTSLGEEQLLDLKSLGVTMGLDVGDLDKMSEQETIRTVSNKMALRLRNPESGMGLTGNTSNKDLQFLKDSVVGLNRTRKGNIKVIDLMQRYNKMNMDVANYQQQIIAQNAGAPPADLDTKLMDYVNDYKILTVDERAEIELLKTQEDLNPVIKAIRRN